jgi:flagellar hook protein FlgE
MSSLIGTMGSGISALKTFVKGLEVIGNNIANVNTTGFKGADAKYSDSFSNLLQRSSPTPPGGQGSNSPAVQIGTGVSLAGITTNFSQGSLASTGKTTDLGISGNGFFRVRDVQNSREFVTRSGDFRVDDQGYLVTQQGFRVQGLADGAIDYAATDVAGVLTYTPTTTNAATVGDIQLTVALTVGSGLTNSTGGSFTNAQVEAGAPTLRSFSIDQYGNAVAFMSDGSSFTKGKVLLQDFRDASGLTKEGSNLFSGFESAGAMGGMTLTAANNSAGTNGLGRIQSGSLELSNVDLTEQFSSLITTQRSFQAGSRLITVSDTILEDIVNLKR